MIYLDSGATSFRKPPEVARAVCRAMAACANPGRGGYAPAMKAAGVMLNCREQAGRMFDCRPEQVVFTSNCTHGLNMAIRSLIPPGGRVVISGFEHNSVTRPLHALGAKITVAGRKLFDPGNTLEELALALDRGQDGAVFTHVSNVFGFILPIQEMVALCRAYGVPVIVDAAQSAGTLPVKLRQWGADFIAMLGHKGLLGPQGTGLLLCGGSLEPLLQGGTGSQSIRQKMPEFLPDRGEAGTANVPGVAGLSAGLAYLERVGMEKIHRRETAQARRCAGSLERMGLQVFSGPCQSGTLSFRPEMDCEVLADRLARRGVAVRAGLHCAPLAHESAGTLETGTVRVSFGIDANPRQTEQFLQILQQALRDKS